MKIKFFAIICVLAMVFSLMACGGEGEETTISAMVTAVDGTVITMYEFSGDIHTGGGQRPQGFGNGEGFDPEQFGGTMPEGFEGGNFTRPNMEGFDPEQFGGTMPEGFEGGDFTMPNMEGFDPEQFGGTMPEGFDPEKFPGGRPGGNTDGENVEGTRPSRGEGHGERPSFQMGGNLETTTLDIANVHISVEIDGGKATGSISDIKVGSRITITKNGKGEVTNVLVSANFGFGGFGGMGGFGGQRGGKGSSGTES